MTAIPVQKNTIGTLTIVLTLVGWASVPLFLRHFAESIDVWTSNGWRYGFSALIWAPVLIIAAKRNRLPHGLWKAAIIPSVVNVLGQVCFVWGHYKIDPGLLSFGLRSQLIFVAVGAYLLFPSERKVIRSWRYILGMLILLGGTAAALLWGKQSINLDEAWGMILAITSGMFFAFYGLSVRKYMAGMNSVIAFAAISQYTAAVMVVLMLLLGQSAGLSALEMANNQIILLLFSSVIGIALGHVLYYISIARLGVAVSAGVLQLHPFLVAIGSLFLFQEKLALGQWIGGCVAVIGALLMLRQQRIVSRQEYIDEMEVAIAEGESGS